MIYSPNGNGQCRNCGRDVGAHDGGHPFHPYGLLPNCRTCGDFSSAPIHDVGRVLRCPDPPRVEFKNFCPRIEYR